MIATSLTPYIGYYKNAKIVKEAYKRDCSIKEIILEKKLMTEDDKRYKKRYSSAVAFLFFSHREYIIFKPNIINILTNQD